jgi:hypothetical protein
VALMLACLTITAASAYSQAPPPHKKILIKIIVDGKEIELTDELIQTLLAAKKQAPPTPRTNPPQKEAQQEQDALKALQDALKVLQQAEKLKFKMKAVEPTRKLDIKMVVDGKEIDPARVLAGDGKLVVAGKGKYQAFDAKTGKLLWEITMDRDIVIVDPATGKVLSPDLRAPNPPAPGANVALPKNENFWYVQSAGKKVLIRVSDPRIEDLVKQAEAIKPGSGAAVREALKGGLMLLHAQGAVTSAPVHLGQVYEYKVIDKKAIQTGTPTATELDALRAQIQRLSAELEALRNRLDAQKK